MSHNILGLELVITKLCPSAELRSLRDITSGLSESQEQELVESVQKGPRKKACLCGIDYSPGY